MKRLQLLLHIKHRKQRRDRSSIDRQGVFGKVGFALSVFGLLLVSAAAIYTTWQFSLITRKLPSIENLAGMLDPISGIFSKPTRLMDRSGTAVLAELGLPGIESRYRTTKLTENGHISEDFINAVVASTEPNFWNSPGFSLRSFNPNEHATIAQRLVFALLLSQEAPDLNRALREKLLASQVVAKYGREQVLEWYLNTVEFGHYAYGIEAASQTYLRKTSAELTLPDAAMLAGVSLAPAINPWDSEAGAKVLQQEVLKQMAVQRMITTEIFRTALQVPVQITEKQSNPSSKWPAFTAQTISQLEKALGKNMVERGGLLVQTSLDLDLQTQTDCVLRESSSALTQDQAESTLPPAACRAARLLPVLPPMTPLPQGSIRAGAVVLNPQNGQILAYYDTTEINQDYSTTKSFPTGSLITPFIYLNSFAQGFSPSTLVWDAPINGQNNGENNSAQFNGPVRIRTALANDYLQPLKNVLAQSGISSFGRLTRSLGFFEIPVVSEAEKYPVMSATLVETAGAYGILANQGIQAGVNETGNESLSLVPSFILNVWNEQGTKILDWETPGELAIISPQLAYLINDILSDDLARAPSLGYPSILQIGKITAAKLGISEDKHGAWTAGYSPERVIVTWVGNMDWVDSGVEINARWAAGNWRALMQYSTADLPATNWSEPPGIVHIDVCDPSGLLPTADCPNIVPEIFVSGNEPSQYDDLYIRRAINFETGKLATVFTPQEMIQEKVFLNVPEQYLDWSKKAGLPLLPDSYDAVREDTENPAVHFSAPLMFEYIHGKVSIIGTASSKDFASYKIEAGMGLNPEAWVQIGETGTKPIIERQLAVWDTTGQNGLYALRLQVIDQDNRLMTSTIQVTVDNNPPVIILKTSMDATGSTVEVGQHVLISAEIQDETGLTHVVFIVDGVEKEPLKASPYGYLWKASSGKHTFQVKAADLAGNLQLSDTLELNVPK